MSTLDNSYQDLKQYYLKGQGTDYAKSQGLIVSTNSSTLGYSHWWSRSANYNGMDYVYYLHYDSSISILNAYYTCVGDRAVCWINLQ